MSARADLEALGCRGFSEHARGDMVVVSWRGPDGIRRTRHTRRPLAELYADELRDALAEPMPRPPRMSFRLARSD